MNYMQWILIPTSTFYEKKDKKRKKTPTWLSVITRLLACFCECRFTCASKIAFPINQSRATIFIPGARACTRSLGVRWRGAHALTWKPLVGEEKKKVKWSSVSRHHLSASFVLPLTAFFLPHCIDWKWETRSWTDWWRSEGSFEAINRSYNVGITDDEESC